MKTLVALSASSIIIILAGCSSTGSLTEIAANQQKQTAQMKEICCLIENQNRDIAAIRKIAEKRAEKQTDSDNTHKNLLAAALLLAKQGSGSIPYNAIQILGYIGGPEAEEALLDMLENDYNKRYLSNIVNALTSMNSGKLRDVIIKTMKNGSPGDINNIINSISNNSSNIFKKSDAPLLVDLLDNMPQNNNSFYSRCNLIKAICILDLDTGIKCLCNELQIANSNNQRQLLYIPTHNNITFGYANWKKIIDILGEEPGNQNLETFRAVCDGISRSGDYRVTDIVLPWSDFAVTNSNFRNSYMNMLKMISDPKAAKTMLALYNNTDKRNDYHVNNFPGIIKKDGKYQLADPAVMEKLMAQRERVIERLNARDEKRGKPPVKDVKKQDSN